MSNNNSVTKMDHTKAVRTINRTRNMTLQERCNSSQHLFRFEPSHNRTVLIESTVPKSSGRGLIKRMTKVIKFGIECNRCGFTSATSIPLFQTKDQKKMRYVAL